MLLAIDIGNSNIVFGIHDGETWVNEWRILTVADKTADEYEVIFRSLLTNSIDYIGKVDRIVVSSVVPQLLRAFSEMLGSLFPVTPLVVGPEIYPLLPLKVLNPYEIGTDLIANSMAAYNRFRSLCTVVDFGTALTLTTISDGGEILGVSIAPGLKTAIKSLTGNTAQLPSVHLTPPPSVLGENTVHALQSGIVLGYSGLVDHLIDLTRNELGKLPEVIATGGLANVISPISSYIRVVDQQLTLEGLRLIGDTVEKH
ncbi:MAG: type III pantothenate kinase [Candidatus Marinimicrobia bacterium]|nr:type III pantothenate kinase [Candidatus Neomarinimicrobiota bacterium]